MKGLYIKPSTKVIVVRASRSYLIEFDPNVSTSEQLSIRPGGSAMNADLDV